MALTITPDAEGRQNLGPSGIIAVVTIQPAAADYPAGGYTITPAQFDGLSRIRGVLPIGYTGTAATHVWAWNKTTGKLQVFAASGGTPAGTIVSTATAPTITTTTNAGTTTPLYTNAGALTQVAGAAGITGVQAPTVTSTFTGTPGAGGAMAEVAAGTDLSGGTVTLFGYGF